MTASSSRPPRSVDGSTRQSDAAPSLDVPVASDFSLDDVLHRLVLQRRVRGHPLELGVLRLGLAHTLQIGRLQSSVLGRLGRRAFLLSSLIVPCTFPVRFPVRMKQDSRLFGSEMAFQLALRRSSLRVDPPETRNTLKISLFTRIRSRRRVRANLRTPPSTLRVGDAVSPSCDLARKCGGFRDEHRSVRRQKPMFLLAIRAASLKRPKHGRLSYLSVS